MLHDMQDPSAVSSAMWCPVTGCLHACSATGTRPQHACAGAQICEGVRRETPTDEHVLSLLALVYKPLGQRSMLTQAYEAASAARPQDLHLLHGLFAAYVRCWAYAVQRICPLACIPPAVRAHLLHVVPHATMCRQVKRTDQPRTVTEAMQHARREGDLVRQQQVAMRWHRAEKGSSKPLWWIVTTLVLQARCAGGGSARHTVLTDRASLRKNMQPWHRSAMYSKWHTCMQAAPSRAA